MIMIMATVIILLLLFQSYVCGSSLYGAVVIVAHAAVMGPVAYAN